jgi:hypothetical protein
MRRNEIFACLNPTATIAFLAAMAFGAVAHKVDLDIPLAMARAPRAARVKIAVAWMQRNAIKGVRRVRARTLHNALFV